MPNKRYSTLVPITVGFPAVSVPVIGDVIFLKGTCHFVVHVHNLPVALSFMLFLFIVIKKCYLIIPIIIGVIIYSQPI